MKKVFLTLMGASLISAAAMSYADYSPYVDLGFGAANREDMPSSGALNDLPDVVPVGTGTSDESNYGARLALGVLWNPEMTVSYGLEAGVAYYGMTKYSNDISDVEMNYYGIELLGVTQLNLDKLHLLLKAGVTDEQLHPTKSNIDDADLSDSNTVLPEVGAGIAYSVAPDFQIGLSYYHTFGQDVSFDSNGEAENLPAVDMALLEIVYHL